MPLVMHVDGEKVSFSEINTIFHRKHNPQGTERSKVLSGSALLDIEGTRMQTKKVVSGSRVLSLSVMPRSFCIHFVLTAIP